MLDFNSRDGPRPKCYFTSSKLPAYIDHGQIPSKKKPFCTISSFLFAHTVCPSNKLTLLKADEFQLSMVMPTDRAEAFKKSLDSNGGTLQYAKVYMTPRDLLEGDFFNQYIKSGTSSTPMLSQPS
jgi:ribonucleases P/MRP protein subunit RPP40